MLEGGGGVGDCGDSGLSGEHEDDGVCARGQEAGRSLGRAGVWGEDASKVGEVRDNCELLAVNSEDRHFRLVGCLLHDYLSFGCVDFESKGTVYGGYHIKCPLQSNWCVSEECAVISVLELQDCVCVTGPEV